MARWSQEQVEAEIARLRDLSLEELRAQWQRQMRSPAPACFKSDLLFRTLAYQLQVKALGGLDRATERLLDRLAEAEDPTAVLASLRRRRIKPGTELIGEWAGTAHRVVVTEGGFGSKVQPSARLIAAGRSPGSRRYVKRPSERLLF